MTVSEIQKTLEINQKWALKIVYMTTYAEDYMQPKPQVFFYENNDVIIHTYSDYPVDFIYCSDNRIYVCIIVYL